MRAFSMSEVLGFWWGPGALAAFFAAPTAAMGPRLQSESSTDMFSRV